MVIGHSTWKNMYRSKYDKSTTASPTQKSQPEVTKTNWQRASLSQRPTNKELHGHKGTVISWLFFILWTWILLWLDFFSLFWWFLESDFFCLDDSSFSFYFSLSWWLLLLVLKVHLALIAPSCLYNPHHPSSISTSNKDLTHTHSNHQYQEQTISQPWASTLHSCRLSEFIRFQKPNTIKRSYGLLDLLLLRVRQLRLSKHLRFVQPPKVQFLRGYRYPVGFCASITTSLRFVRGTLSSSTFQKQSKVVEGS